MVIIFIFILVKIYLKHGKMAPGQDYFLLLVRLSQNVRCSLLSPWSIFFLDDFIFFNILFKNTFSTCLFLNINGGRELLKKSLSWKGWLMNPCLFCLRTPHHGGSDNVGTIWASIFLSSDFSLSFLSFTFFFELRCQPHQPVLLLSARKIKRKKREKESNALNTKIKFFSVSAVSSVHFHWVFFTNLFLSSFTIGYAQENLWFISRKQRPWQAPEHYNPTVGEAGQEPKFVHA